jgi:Uma2 family endonuclease
MSLVETVYVPSPEVRMALEDVSWETYLALSEGRQGSIPRMTYSDGVLEMMSPLRKHENIGRLIGRIVETYSEVKDIDIISVKSMTVKRSDLKKAFEPDESYYVTHAIELQEKEELDFEFDPPPDLVIEVQITSSAIEKMPLFASIGVREVWLHDGKTLRMYRLAAGTYQSVDSSVELPGLSVERINQLLAKRNKVSETKFIQCFRLELQQES